jgi:hypothetical protein
MTDAGSIGGHPLTVGRCRLSGAVRRGGAVLAVCFDVSFELMQGSFAAVQGCLHGDVCGSVLAAGRGAAAAAGDRCWQHQARTTLSID